MTAVDSTSTETTPLLQNEAQNVSPETDLHDAETVEAAKPKVSRAAVVRGLPVLSPSNS